MTIIVTGITLDRSVSAWRQYENFYGLLMNSAFLNFPISVILFVFELEFRELNMVAPDREEFRAFNFSMIVFGLCLIFALPALATHILPAMIVYFWVFLIALITVAVCSIAIEWVSRILYDDNIAVFEVLLERHNSFKILYVLLLASWRLFMVYIFQTLYNYMYLFYAIDEVPVPANQYLGVIADEYSLRSQTACLFHHYTDNIGNVLIFFNWL